ncbi:MAG: CAP domain-containing protein, partial [Oscillochloridaceae bacterium umkhey_bin13]
GHSQDMAQRGYFSHFSPEGRDPSDRVDATGYQWQMVGENIASGYRTPQEVVAGWMDSPGHRANILRCEFTEIGIGYFERPDDPSRMRTYWTQVFATPWE